MIFHARKSILLSLFLIGSLSSFLYATDPECIEDNRTEQGVGVIINGVCVDPPPLPYDDRPVCGDDLKLVQGNDNNCTEGVLATDPGPYPQDIVCPVGKVVDQGTGECTIDAPSTTEPLPENITIYNVAKIIVSTYDDTPYDPAIDIQGIIDTNVTISVPYTVVNHGVRLPARTISVGLDASVTEDGESGIMATFSWLEQASLPVGSGTFTAILSINDSAGNNDSIYNAKKLDINNTEGLVAASFPYATDSIGNEGNLTLKIHPGILDRMFRMADNNGDTDTHEFIYFPMTNPVTGKTWLGNNLGANYANMNMPAVFNPSKQAEDSYDYDAFGSSFQWGRKADGHEFMQWASGTSGTGVNGTTTVLSDEPTTAAFIIGPEPIRDWRINPNDGLWEDEVGVNNVCPVGYRVPTRYELLAETNSWYPQNYVGALSSLLVMPMQGTRRYFSGGYQAWNGTYWSSTPWVFLSSISAFQLWIKTDGIEISSRNRAAAGPVRCIKD